MRRSRGHPGSFGGGPVGAVWDWGGKGSEMAAAALQCDMCRGEQRNILDDPALFFQYS